MDLTLRFNNSSLDKKFDINNDGKTSLKDLEKLAKKDGNNSDLSINDLESIGIKDSNIQKAVIDLYNKHHSSSPNSFSFDAPRKNNNSSDGPGDGSWKNDMVSYGDAEDIIKKEAREFKKSELTSDSANELYSLTGKNKEVGHYISKLFEENPEQAEKIVNSLSTYINSESSSNALFNDPKIKKEYVKNLLRDISYPTDIYQGNKGTCGATAVQVQLAMEDPQKYIEIATSLADGKSWKGISPNRNFEDSGDNRNLSAQVIQNAFMDYGNGGSVGDWSSKQEDKTTKKSSGITTQDVSELQDVLFGDSKNLSAEHMSKDKLFKIIDENLKNSPIPFSVKDEATGIGHEMLILSKENGFYKVFTWGEERLMSEEDLRTHLRTAQIAKF